MNIDMLNYIGFKGNTNDLNSITNIKLTLSVLVDAINVLGLQGFLNFHRGGRTAFLNPVANDARYGLTTFKVGVYNIMKVYENDLTLFNDGRKVWAQIPHVWDYFSY